MKFTIDKPVAGAVGHEFYPRDCRTCKSMEEVAKESWGKQWLETGSDHRVDPDGVSRRWDHKEVALVVEVEDMDVLLELAKSNGYFRVVCNDRGREVLAPWHIELDY